MVNVRDGMKYALVTNQQVHVLQEGNMGVPFSNQRTYGFAEEARPW